MSSPRGFLSRLDALIHSIRFRLVLWFVLILSFVLVVFSTLLFFARIRELRADTLNRLEAKNEGIERFLRSGALAFTDPEALRSGEDPLLGSSDVLALMNADGSPAYLSGPLAQPPILDFSHMEVDPRDHTVEYRTYFRSRSVDMYAFLITPVVSANRVLAGFIVVGTPIDPEGVLKNLLITLLLLTGLMLVLAFAGGFWLADRALRPVQTITAQARNIGETDLSARFRLGRKDEIGQLADTFDSMLARLETAFTRQRQFTADASHELRTPLTIVNLEASRALAAPRKSAEYQRALEIIRSENESMSRLVNDLLTLARMDAGREPLQMEPLDLSGLALEAVERLEQLASRLGVHLKMGSLPEARVRGDGRALLRLLTNLIENSLKYTAANPPEAVRNVLVETGLSPDGASAWARISDTGPGIPADHLPHIFDRFYRVDKARAQSLGDSQQDSAPVSSGLGLAIVQGIAALHSGRVEAQSRLGEGSQFTLFLPLA